MRHTPEEIIAQQDKQISILREQANNLKFILSKTIGETIAERIITLSEENAGLRNELMDMTQKYHDAANKQRTMKEERDYWYERARDAEKEQSDEG